jgi:hypothetical protein
MGKFHSIKIEYTFRILAIGTNRKHGAGPPYEASVYRAATMYPRNIQINPALFA